MKNYSKTRVKKASSVKAPKSFLGPSSSTSTLGKSPLNPQKKSYAKSKGPSADQFGNISFGNTGMTGED